jgi:hypothetical protein
MYSFFHEIPITDKDNDGTKENQLATVGYVNKHGGPGPGPGPYDLSVNNLEVFNVTKLDGPVYLNKIPNTNGINTDASNELATVGYVNSQISQSPLNIIDEIHTVTLNCNTQKKFNIKFNTSLKNVPFLSVTLVTNSSTPISGWVNNITSSGFTYTIQSFPELSNCCKNVSTSKVQLNCLIIP